MMILWMPVLGHDHVLKERSHPMDYGHHFLAARHREGASIAEVILHVDHQQHIPVNQLYTHFLETIPQAKSERLFTHRGDNFFARVVETLQNLNVMLSQ